jgi:hypothetical protein
VDFTRVCRFHHVDRPARAMRLQLRRGDFRRRLYPAQQGPRDKSLELERRAQLFSDVRSPTGGSGWCAGHPRPEPKPSRSNPEHAPFYNNRGNILLAIGWRMKPRDFDRAVLWRHATRLGLSNRRPRDPGWAIATPHRRLHERHPLEPRAHCAQWALVPFNSRPTGRSRPLRAFHQDDRARSRTCRRYRNRARARMALANYSEPSTTLSRPRLPAR